MSVNHLDGAVGFNPWEWVRSQVASLSNMSARPKVNLGLVLGTNASWIVRRGARKGSEATCMVADAPKTAGLSAQRLEGREPVGVVLSRPFYAGRVQRRGHAISLVKHFLKSGNAQVVVAVPHDLTPTERRTVEQVVLSAGAQTVYLVDESLAAGLGAGLAVMEPRTTVTMDLGASSTRVSVMSLGKVTRSRVLPVGGDALSEAVVDFMAQQHGLKIGARTAERVKHTIGCAIAPDSPTPMEVDGISIASGLPIRLTVHAADVCAALQPTLLYMADHLRRALEEVQPQLLADGTPSVSLIGGGARLNGVAAFMRQHIHLGVQVHGDSDGVVAAGLDMLLSQRDLRRALLSPASTAAIPIKEVRQNPGLVWTLGAVSILLCCQLLGPAIMKTSSIDSSLTAGMVPVWQTFDHVAHPSALTTIDPAQRLLMRQLRESEERNSALSQELQSVKAENGRLRSLTHMTTQWSGPATQVGAQIVARDPNAWMQTVILNIGKKNHVAPGMPVTSEAGIIGTVSEVTDTSSRIHTITFQGATTAGLVGKAAGVIYGMNGHTCEMRYLDPNAGVKAGDLVKTSGQDAYPEGLPVGRIVEVHPAADGASWTATVRPTASLDTVRDVVVVQKTK